MKKIKVLHLIESLETGGMEKVVELIAEGLDKGKYDVEVWAIARGGDIAEELESKGVDVRVLGITSYYNVMNFFKLADLIRGVRPGIIHTHGYFSGTIGRISAKLAKVPVILSHVHSTYWGYSKRNLFIEKVLSYVTDKIICCSEAVKDFVVGYECIAESKTEVIYNGICRNDVQSDPAEIRRQFSLDENSMIITAVGSLTPHKGHRYLLEAMPRIRHTYPGVKCLIVGDGPLRGELEEMSMRLGLQDNVIFIGKIKNVYDVLSITDVFVMPSSGREGLGLAAIEALFFGVPAIVSNVGGLKEVVEDGKNGFLVKPKDPDMLAEKVVALLGDDPKRQEFGKRSKEIFFNKFTAKMMLTKIDELYQEQYEKSIISA